MRDERDDEDEAELRRRRGEILADGESVRVHMLQMDSLSKAVAGGLHAAAHDADRAFRLSRPGYRFAGDAKAADVTFTTSSRGAVSINAANVLLVAPHDGGNGVVGTAVQLADGTRIIVNEPVATVASRLGLDSRSSASRAYDEMCQRAQTAYKSPAQVVADNEVAAEVARIEVVSLDDMQKKRDEAYRSAVARSVERWRTAT